MYLKSLEIQGFKSFPDRTVINFDRGLSAIIGPNGCGKSNIVDAIKWVIGEQSTKSLRAEKMEHVIFNGTDDRKPVGMAEITLVIINDKDILPNFYNEVSIMRRLYRSGESEYYINKQRCRLKDIIDLFLDTGVGKSAYSIMEQGKIDLILSNKPEDRRYIIEEAAGITKYKVKKSDAQKQLMQANNNLIRLNDIIAEVKIQYNNTRKQAEIATQYKELKQKETDLEIDLALNRLQKLENDKKNQETDINADKDEMHELSVNLKQLKSKIEYQLDELNQLETEKLKSQRKSYEIDGEIRIVKNKISAFAERNQELRQLIEQNENLRHSFAKKLENTVEFINNTEKEIKQTDDYLVDIEKDMVSYQNEINHLKDKRDKIKSEIIQNEKNLISEEDKNRKNKEDLNQLLNELTNILRKSVRFFMEEKSSADKQKQDIKYKLDSLCSEIHSKHILIDDFLNSEFLLKNNIPQIIKNLREINTVIQNMENDLNLIRDFLNNYFLTQERFINKLFNPDGIMTKIRNLEDEMAQCMVNQEKIKANIKNLNQETQDLLKKHDDLTSVLHELKINHSKFTEKMKNLKQSRKKYEQTQKEYEKQKNEFEQKIQSSEIRIKELQGELESNQTLLENKKEEKLVIDKSINSFTEDIKALNEKRNNLNIELESVEEKYLKLKKLSEERQMALIKINTTINNIFDNFYENYSINLKDFKDREVSFDYNENRKELTKIKAKIRSLGNVNLLAIEEYKDLETRYEFLTKQVNDLKQAKSDIQSMMTDIDEISARLFLETFHKIKKNFHDIFRRLFEGGKADIQMVDSENILDTGIDVIVQPPGKKPLSINMLSGGERAITATALMFAVFLVKPSPFCILDEIDAPLDEQNIARFTSMINEFTNETQFLIITHNKITMNSADVLYGVTMEENGVSKLVSVKFEKDKNAVVYH